MGDRECTHLVVDEAVTELPTDIRLPRHVVKGEVSYLKGTGCTFRGDYSVKKVLPPLIWSYLELILSF